LLARGWWFSPGAPASSTTKTGRHDIAEILLKVALNTINQIKSSLRGVCKTYWQLRVHVSKSFCVGFCGPLLFYFCFLFFFCSNFSQKKTESHIYLFIYINFHELLKYCSQQPSSSYKIVKKKQPHIFLLCLQVILFIPLYCLSFNLQLLMVSSNFSHH